MKQLLLFWVLLALFNTDYAQQHALAKQWDQRYGGLLEDDIWSAIQTVDGGYMLGGSSYSGVGGDKIQNNWDTSYNTYDYWVVKLDAWGQKTWDRRFGGLYDDGLTRVRQTFDGNFILAGYSASDSGGSRTQSSRGGFDYWIVKIDENGNKLWDKRFGGPAEDDLFALEQTTDSGFIWAGFTYSDSGGDIHQHSRGGTDYWVVKTDALGNLQWEKRFGGSNMDFLYDVKQTHDRGFLLGGVSLSDISGDRTVANSFNEYDYWIVKLDSTGHKLWDNAYGGNYGGQLKSILCLADGGYLLGGDTYSGISGDKTTPNQGGEDYWIVKIDSVGNKLWDKDYGGTQNDELRSLALTNDGGYLLSGDSWSSTGGSKSENNTAHICSWVVKVDSSGNIQWDKTIFLNKNALRAGALETSDECYMITNGNVASVGYYKTQNPWDALGGDYWIVKFCDTLISGIEDGPQTQDTRLIVSPNPFTSDIAIAVQPARPFGGKDGLKEANFTITNTLGQIVFTRKEDNLSSSYTKMLDLSWLPNGLYILEVVVDGEVITKQIVKQ